MLPGTAVAKVRHPGEPGYPMALECFVGLLLSMILAAHGQDGPTRLG